VTDSTGAGPLPAALVLHGDCGLHDTGWRHPEHQGRLPAIVNAIYRDTPALLDRVLQHEARPADESQLRRVHSAAHMDTVRAAAARAVSTRALVALDADTIVSPASWDAALAAAGCVIDAVDIVMAARAGTAIALCRPPGHHATSDRAMGFCIFNNVAVAVRHAQAEHDIARVLVIDWDVHHGNGTQDVFYEDDAVFFLSLHLDGAYPGTGSSSETGARRGAGMTLNVPLPAGTSRDDYADAFERALDRAYAAARPDLVIVSAGYDCLAGDPLGGLLLEPEDMYDMTRAVMARADQSAAGRLVLALEGGYAPRRVGAAVVETMHALTGLPRSPPPY
jgi:acetoin utilization deacetylase AcuC-like enzyme